jgi:hypothetical protein
MRLSIARLMHRHQDADGVRWAEISAGDRDEVLSRQEEAAVGGEVRGHCEREDLVAAVGPTAIARVHLARGEHDRATERLETALAIVLVGGARYFELGSEPTSSGRSSLPSGSARPAST